MLKRVIWVLVLALLLAACGGGRKAPSDGGSQTASPSPAKPAICPLTGVQASSGVTADRPALAVKVDNAPPARPQAGLEAADIVYEEIGEGGLSRFLSFFQCNDADSVGPVRSIRNTDLDVLQEYAPVLLGFSGANQQVLGKLTSIRGIVDLRQGSNGSAYVREAGRKAPYNLMSSTQKLRALPGARDVRGPSRTGLVFDAGVLQPAPAPSGTAGAPQAPAPAPGSSVSFSFSASNSVSYTYDPARKTYLRSNGSVPHKSVSGSQLSAVNVVIQKVRVTTGTVRDAAGSPTQDTTVVGSGDAIVLRAGVAVNGKWSRPSLSANTTFTDASGQTIKFAPGNTWIELLPAERPVTLR